MRRSLGVAAGDHNPGIRVFPMDPADSGAGILVGGGSDGAGVEHDNVRFEGRIGWGKALCRKLALQGGPVSLGGPATEVLHKKSRHNRYYNGDFRLHAVRRHLPTLAFAPCT